MEKTALVLGAGGFIGSHMVRRLKNESYRVVGVDLKRPDFSDSLADQFIEGDLRDSAFVHSLVSRGLDAAPFCEIYQFAADMGGAGYIFVGNNDADIMHNSASINLNVLESVKSVYSVTESTPTVFYSSSACIYPESSQLDPDNVDLPESAAYPANPDSEYGWEKLFSERLYLAYNRNHGIPVRIARYHNIYGPEGTWDGGKEKAPAAICRKVALSGQTSGEIEIWGDGEQTRSFLYIDECIEATRRLMSSDFQGPVNIGSEEMVTINELVRITAKVSQKSVSVRHINGPTGVRGRNSNNVLIRKELNWDYSMSLEMGISKTYEWIEGQVAKREAAAVST
jgi:GDP-D-mannose 3', 5'-epimerase